MPCGHLLYPTCGCPSAIITPAPNQVTTITHWTPPDLANYHADGWASAITGIGTAARDKRLSHRFEVASQMSYQEVARLWEQDDIAAKAIEELPAACFGEGYEITIGDEGSYEDLKEEIEDRLLELEVDNAIENAMQYERAYGGGAILLGTADHRSLAEPLENDSTSSLDWLNVLEPMEIVPESTYEDPGAAKYGKPEFYRINTNGSSGIGTMHTASKKKTVKNGLAPHSNVIIHESRLITFGGIRVSQYLKSSNTISPFWGASMVHRFIEALRDFGVSYAGAGLLATDVSQPVVSIDGLKEMVGKDESRLRARMAALELGRSSARMILLDSKSEKFERQTTNLAGVPDLLDRLSLRLSAAIGMPLSVLLGYSPATLGTPGEGELQQWHGKIRSTQRRRLSPIMRRLIKMIIRGLRQRKIPKKFDIEWNELQRMSELQRAEARLNQARTDSMNIKAGMIDPDEARTSRFKGKYSFETQIKEHKKAPGFVVPLPAGVLPGSTPGGAAGGAGGAKPAGPNAHSVGGYARRNPTAPALGANAAEGGDKAPENKRDEADAFEIEILQDELKHTRERREALQASGSLTKGVAALLDDVERQALLCLEDLGVGEHADDGTGNHVEFNRFRIVIESPKGAVRTWVDSDGTPGQTVMANDYGYIEGSLGADGDSVDVYLGPNEQAEWVYVIHQNKKSANFEQYDEDKCVLGADSANHAKDLYLRNYDDPRFFGGMSQMKVEDFREKLNDLLASRITNAQ